MSHIQVTKNLIEGTWQSGGGDGSEWEVLMQGQKEAGIGRSEDPQQVIP